MLIKGFLLCVSSRIKDWFHGMNSNKATGMTDLSHKRLFSSKLLKQSESHSQAANNRKQNKKKTEHVFHLGNQDASRYSHSSR
jgi:hypothetical protein